MASHSHFGQIPLLYDRSRYERRLPLRIPDRRRRAGTLLHHLRVSAAVSRAEIVEIWERTVAYLMG